MQSTFSQVEESTYSIPFVGVTAVRNPIMGSKVNRFSNIGTHGKASMECSWERHYIFSLVLKQFVDRNFSILQKARTKHGCDMVQEVRYISHFHGQIILEHLFQSICVLFRSWNTVPLFYERRSDGETK